MNKIRDLFERFLFILSFAVFFSVGSASAAENPPQGEDILLSTYHRIGDKIGKSNLDPPIFLESFEQDNSVHVDVYGIFDYPFSNVVSALKVPANWCEIVSLHPNIKACTYKELPGDWLLSFYLGRKFYQPPEDTRQVNYHYRKIDQQQEYLNIMLNADEGPFGTKDHMIKFESIPLDGRRTFVHISYRYTDSTALRLAGKLYFATLGSGKVGFTVTGKDSNGNPVYITGPRGAVERNAVRYYFAIQSFMDTLRYTEEDRFSMRTSEWYDLTSIYGKQLFELEKNDYLTFKAMEHMNQVKLQQQTLTDLQ